MAKRYLANVRPFLQQYSVLLNLVNDFKSQKQLVEHEMSKMIP